VQLLRSSLLLLILTWITGCAHTGHYPEDAAPAPVADTAVDMGDTGRVKNLLMLQHEEWQGTRYQLGGLSRQGIDCSGFVYQTFRSRLGLELPRTTQMQSRTGHSVPVNNRQPGDLVFFQTGYKKRHVGIYLGNGEFLHASSSQGVTISSLDNQYWQSNYWHSRRVSTH